MKTKLIVLLALALCGCAVTKATYRTYDPTTGRLTKSVSYSSSKDITAEVNTNGTLKIEGKASTVIDAQSKAIGYVAGEVAKGAVEGMKP